MSTQPNIIWLASYPKSGNTWLRVLLSNLLSERDSPVDINKIPENKMAGDRTLIDSACGLNSSDLNDDEIDMLRPQVYEELNRSSREMIFIKVHDAWLKNKKGEALFNAGITRGVIYMIRHPLDVAISFARHNGISNEEAIKRLNSDELSLSGDPDKLGNQCRQKLLSWSAHVESWVDTSKLPVHVLRYEDLLADTSRYFAGILDFLSIPIIQSDLVKAVHWSSFKILKDQEKEAGFLEKPTGSASFFHTGRQGNWKKELSADLSRDFFERNKKTMQRFKYSL